jgi:hypothetical protein
MAQRPRRHRFEDPAAEVVWAAITALDEGLQHEVLVELRSWLGDPVGRGSAGADRAARAIAALRRVAEELGKNGRLRSPSVGEYRLLRESKPELSLPPDGSVRRWLGGDWNEALKQARLDAVPEPLAMAPALGPISKEEAIAAVRACADETGGPPSAHIYSSWARREDVRRRPGRRPRTPMTIIRLLGSWAESLLAAGLVQDRGTGLSGSVRGGGRGFTEEQLLVAMAEVVEYLGVDELPPHSRYAVARREILEREDAAGLPFRGFPGQTVIGARFGGWPKAREALRRYLERPEEGPDAERVDEG